MVLCWWCCHPFEGEALNVPYKYDELKKKFYTTGIFCSWACMKAYAVDAYGITRGGIISQNISLMRMKTTKNLKSVCRAPNRYCLKAFGGTMDIEEFRNVGADNFPHLQMPNAIYMSPHILNKTSNESRSMATARDNKSKMEEINNSTTTTETLRLKRPKPLARDKNNLESMLGITRTSKK